MNDQTTTYTLDLNAGLTQVLSDGRRDDPPDRLYLYGADRLAQSLTTEAEYFLGDALGSVRQLVDGSGEITLARAYAPYGETRVSAGDGASAYGYTGEWTDASGLVYLRARYYAPDIGRFITRDTWGGDVNRTLSYNRWLYGYGNPIGFTDSSGKIPSENRINDMNMVYSCNCGWIDFSHANPTIAAIVDDLLGSEDILFNPEPVGKYRKDVFAISPKVPLLHGLIKPSITAVIRRGLGKSRKLEVALGVYRRLEEQVEVTQFPAYWSYYSLEDLASDEIGFYLYKNFGRDSDPRKNEAVWLWLAEECGFPVDRVKARNWSLNVFRGYQMSRLEWASIKIFTWGTPWLCDNASTNCGASKRAWPSAFTQIVPAQAQRDGDWWLYNLFRDGLLYSPPNTQGIFLLHKPPF